MTPVWALWREEVLSDCLVSPDIFHQMVDRLAEFVVPYQQALEAEAGSNPMHLYLQGLLSHLQRKNAEEIATLVDVERRIIQDFVGIVPWNHRPLVTVLVGQGVNRLGEPDGIIAFDPSSFPKRGTPSVGVKRQWCGHRGKVDNCQIGVFMGYVSRHDHALLDFRLYLPKEWVRDGLPCTFDFHGDCSKDTGFIQPVPDGVRRAFVVGDTAERLRELHKLNRAVEVYLTQLMPVSEIALREGMRAFGSKKPTQVVIWETLMDARTVLLTANTETVYAMSHLDLKTDGPTVVEAPPQMLGFLQDGLQRYLADIGP